MQWYVDVLKKYAGFSGRAQRKEYWMFVLYNLLISIVLEYIDSMISHNTNTPFEWLYSLAIVIPSLAVLFRRLHDTGRSGWSILWLLLPAVGWIILLVFTATDLNLPRMFMAPILKMAGCFNESRNVRSWALPRERARLLTV